MSVTPANYARIKELFSACLDALMRQGELLADVEPALRAEVESLLRAHEAGGPSLEGVGLRAMGILDLAPGAHVGSWEVLSVLGEGGSGRVFRARRVVDGVEHHVALKLVKRSVDSPATRRRFEREREVLARLQHEHIARYVDGGVTTDGRPWLAMDLVDGLPIDAHCAAHRLDDRAKVALVLQVAHAVHWAHQHLVVHRDLKPGNILVAHGSPRLLDFGIARLLDDDGDLTRTAERVLTPVYASPEQLRGEPVTTATDVYSLGVVLYELLAGRRPREGASLADLLGAHEVAPPPPSRSPELDTIVFRALHADPTARYGSAAEFAEDLERFLAGLPVRARRDTLGYRVRKFVERNRLAVAALCVGALALVGGTLATAWQAHVAQQERARAERRFNEGRQLANAFIVDVYDAIRELSGSTEARKTVLEKGARFLDQLAADGADADPVVLLDLARAYRRIGDVLGNPNDANLGNKAAARESYKKALRLARAALPRDPLARAEEGRLVDHLADLDWDEDHFHEALVGHRAALVAFQDALRLQPTDYELQERVASEPVDIGDDAISLDDRVGARAAYQEGAIALAALARAFPDKPAPRRNLAVTLIKLGSLSLDDGDFAAAGTSYAEALRLREALLAESPTNAGARRELSASHVKLGNLAMKTKDPQAALMAYERALATDRAALMADPANVRARRDVGVTLLKVGDAHQAREETTAACTARREALEVFRALKRDGVHVARDDKAITDLEKLTTGCQ